MYHTEPVFLPKLEYLSVRNSAIFKLTIRPKQMCLCDQIEVAKNMVK